MLRKLPLLADRHTLEAVTRTLGLWDTLAGLVRQGNPISGADLAGASQEDVPRV